MVMIAMFLIYISIYWKVCLWHVYGVVLYKFIIDTDVHVA